MVYHYSIRKALNAREDLCDIHINNPLTYLSCPLKLREPPLKRLRKQQSYRLGFELHY
jgi:hypothetical protein